MFKAVLVQSMRCAALRAWNDGDVMLGHDVQHSRPA